ncbi:MAG: TolC family protein [Bacteroidia bacterium]
MKMVLIRAAYCFLLFFSAVLSAQENSKDELVSGYIKSLSTLWEVSNTKTFDNYIVDSTLSLSSDPFKLNGTANNHQQKELLLRSNTLMQTINKKDVGLKYTLNYQENFNSPVADPQEIVVFKRRAVTGIEWDFLKSGLYESRTKNKILKLEFDALEKKQFSNNLTVFQAKSTEQIIRHFNEKKIEILDARKKLNEEQTVTVEKLWSIKHITKDNYLKAIQNTTDINAQYNLYRNYNEAEIKNRSKFDYDLPILDIDLAKLFQSANITAVDTSVVGPNSEIAKLKSAFINDISLSTYARYSYYDVYNPDQPNRAFMSLGMNFSMPLAFNQKEKREYYMIQSQIANQKDALVNEDIQINLLNYYYEYQYKLKQFKNLYHKRLVFLELLRTERVKHDLNDMEFNPNTALFILDDYWSNAIELLDLKQDMYKILLSLKTRFPKVNTAEYTKPLNLNNLNIASSNPPFKAVYVWSDAFKNHSQTVINEYCKVNEFNPILISYNTTKVYLQQVSEFISKNYTSKLHLMIGSNKLLNTGLVGYLDSLKNNVKLSFVKGIHLDLEPHTLPGFKENKEKAFENYIVVLKQAKKFADDNKLELSVSIPLSYPETVLEELNKNCTTVYLMAYENVDPDFIIKKCAEEKTILKSKCVLALRTKDFENRTDMDQLFKKLGFEKTAYHDLDDLIKFDNNSINVKEDKEKEK